LGGQVRTTGQEFERDRLNVQAEATHRRDYPVVTRQAAEQFRMAFEARNQSLVRHAVAMYHLCEHDLMGRFGKGHGGGDAVDAAQLNALE
jgi:hypothetical protein